MNAQSAGYSFALEYVYPIYRVDRTQDVRNWKCGLLNENQKGDKEAMAIILSDDDAIAWKVDWSRGRRKSGA